MKRLLNDRIVLSAIIFSLLGALLSIATNDTLVYLIKYFVYFLPGILMLWIISKSKIKKCKKGVAVVFAILFSLLIAVIMNLLTRVIMNIPALVTLGVVTYRVFSSKDFLREKTHG